MNDLTVFQNPEFGELRTAERNGAKRRNLVLLIGYMQTVRNPCVGL